MAASEFAVLLAERRAQAHKDQNGEEFFHFRDQAGAAVLSVPPRAVHCPPGMALGHVRGALAGLVEEGVEEGRRQAGGVSPEALGAAREEGRQFGWLEAMGAAAREVERRREAYELAVGAAQRARLDWVASEAVRDALAAAAPGGER